MNPDYLNRRATYRQDRILRVFDSALAGDNVSKILKAQNLYLRWSETVIEMQFEADRLNGRVA